MSPDRTAADRPLLSDLDHAQDWDVLVDDQVPGLAAQPVPAKVVELEERPAGDELTVAQRDAAGRRGQSRPGAGGEDGGGQVDQPAGAAPGLRGDHGQAAGGAAGPAAGDPATTSRRSAPDTQKGSRADRETPRPKT